MFSVKADFAFNGFNASDPAPQAGEFVPEMTRVVEKDKNDKEKKRKKRSDSTLKSAKLRKVADKHAASVAAREGSKGKRVTAETMETMIDKFVNENPQLDAEQLRVDILREHDECEKRCERLSVIMAELVPARESVKNYAELLKRATNTNCAEKRLLGNLSNALRRSQNEHDEMLRQFDARRSTYLKLMARVEALARSANRSSFRAPSTATAAPQSMALTAKVCESSMAVATLDAVDDVTVHTTANGTERSAPVQFAVALGGNRGVVELRGTSSAQVMNGSLGNDYFEVSLARQGSTPVVTAEGELARRMRRQRRTHASKTLRILDSRVPLAAIEASRQKRIEGSGPVKKIEGPRP